MQVFAIEVIIYDSASFTTLFVSKADSNGYLYLVALPKGKRSILKRISRAFLQYLIRKHESLQKRLLLSLFARSQNQYLFPGSIENPQKHVLTDRELIRWWCQVFDEIIQEYSVDPSDGSAEKDATHESSICVKAYLRVPGCDSYETRGFLPSYARYANTKPQRWHASADPLREIANSSSLPERCLIPRFPDDPKARYLDSLDEELPESAWRESDSPSKGPLSGKWRSVKTLEQFWETMAFRQECSSGRLVGFLWAVFTPFPMDVDGQNAEGDPDLSKNLSDGRQETATSNGNNAHHPPNEPTLQNQSKLNGVRKVLPNAPHIPSLDTPGDPNIATAKNLHRKQTTVATDPKPEKAHNQMDQPSPTASIPTATPPSHNWYHEIGSSLLALDYANLAIAKQSTKSWIEQAEALAPSTNFHSFDVVGEEEEPESSAVPDVGQIASNEKKRAADTVTPIAAVIPMGFVRKKVKMGAEANG